MKRVNFPNPSTARKAWKVCRVNAEILLNFQKVANFFLTSWKCRVFQVYPYFSRSDHRVNICVFNSLRNFQPWYSPTYVYYYHHLTYLFSHLSTYIYFSTIMTSLESKQHPVYIMYSRFFLKFCNYFEYVSWRRKLVIFRIVMSCMIFWKSTEKIRSGI